MKAVLIDHMGSDLKVANAARASFGKKSLWREETQGDELYDPFSSNFTLHDKDANLIRYLARGCPAKEMEQLIDSLCPLEHKTDTVAAHLLTREQVRNVMNDYRGMATHWVPFAHCHMTFEITLPIFVARQLIRHVIAVSISEMSRRYVDQDPDYWAPAVEGGWRLAAANVKQGSSEEYLTGAQAMEAAAMLEAHHANCTALYRHYVDVLKIAPEIARIVLPLSSYTDWTWTASLVTVARVCHQRLDPHAQKEIGWLVEDIRKEAAAKYPVSFKALMDFGTE